jgi:hypothetical protein
MRFALRTAVLVALLSGSGTCMADTPTGTLVMQVERLQSDVVLSKELKQQIKTGGIAWGVNGKTLVVTVVDPRYLEFDYGFTTRFGYKHALQLPVGTYQLTVVSREPRRSYSEERLLDRATYLNEDVAVVKIEPGRTTTLEVEPVILDEDSLNPTPFIPTVFAAVAAPADTDAGAEKSAAPKRLPISLRDGKSVAWPDYHGPLKFIPR